MTRMAESQKRTRGGGGGGDKKRMVLVNAANLEKSAKQNQCERARLKTGKKVREKQGPKKRFPAD